MKKLAFIICIALISFSVDAQKKKIKIQPSPVSVDQLEGNNEVSQVASPDAPVFKFEKEVIDYGEIEKDADGKRIFKFTNTGKSPLIISSVKGSCGCTVPSHSAKPIMPGEEGEIEVKYATNRLGAFSKTVTITSNASESIKVLTIKGRVNKESALSLLEKKNKSMIENNN